MLNGGQTGVATGAAAFLCKKYSAVPHEVGRNHIQELQEILLEQGDNKDSLKPGSTTR